jgi:hypothetical protein
MDPWLRPHRRGEDKILASNGWSCSIIVIVLIAISDETNLSRICSTTRDFLPSLPCNSSQS